MFAGTSRHIRMSYVFILSVIMNKLIEFENLDFNKAKRKLTASFTINFANEIFNGHFPSQPILPGVVELEILEKLLKLHLERDILLQQIEEVKFIKSINDSDPCKKYYIDLDIDYRNSNLICSKSTIFNSSLDQIYMKASVIYTLKNYE